MGSTQNTFTCNVCGARNPQVQEPGDRDASNCKVCESSIRLRSTVLALSRALFGLPLSLLDFPRLKSVRGLGISDSTVYAGQLERVFSYTNTYYHREPQLDLMRLDPAEMGKYDFVICSEVLEHVPSPPDAAFQALAQLLKPHGVLILTLPYSLAPDTIEHFPEFTEFDLAELGGKTVLVSRTKDQELRVYDQLTFHAGAGPTLEMRIYSEADIRAKLTAAGLPLIRINSEPCREFGVVLSGPCSLPIVASRQAFVLSSSGVTELVEQWTTSRIILRGARKSRWLRLGRLLGVGPAVGPNWPDVGD